MLSRNSMKPSQARLNDSKGDQVSRRTNASPIGSLELSLSSRSGTESLGKAIGCALTGGEVLALIGELGAGKTALVRGIASGLGAPPNSVSSPTFMLIHKYHGRLPLIHADLYRLHTDAEVETIGLPDYFTGQAVIAIEWADRFPTLLPKDRLEVRLTHRSLTTRKVQLTAHGPQSLRLLAYVKRIQCSSRRSRPSRQAKPSIRRKALKR